MTRYGEAKDAFLLVEKSVTLREASIRAHEKFLPRAFFAFLGFDFQK